MGRLRRLASRLRVLFAGNRADSELDHEINEHLYLLSERFVRQGMRPEAAEQAARRQFGGIAKLREDHREARGMPFLECVLRDVFFSFRLVRRAPGFSLAAISILALGIAATTAVYSVAHAVILAPLPFANPDR